MERRRPARPCGRAKEEVGNARQSNLLLDPSGRCLGTLALPQLEGCNGENCDDRNLWDEFVHSVRSVRPFSLRPENVEAAGEPGVESTRHLGADA
jgi:hypothetical protein